MSFRKEDVLLSFCHALKAEIPDSLRAASFEVKGLHIQFYFFFNGEISEEDKDHISCAIAEVDFPNNTQEVTFLRKDFPEPLPNKGIYAFSRDTPVAKSVVRTEIPYYRLEAQVFLSVWQAMLGKISFELRAIEILYLKKDLDVLFFINSDKKESDFFPIYQAVKEIATDFPEFKVQPHIVNWPYPKQLPPSQDYVFIKKECPLLEGSWQEFACRYLCHYLVGEIPESVRAIAFRMENVTAFQSAGSKGYIYVFFQDEIIKTYTERFKDIVNASKSNLPVADIELIFEKKAREDLLPEGVGFYIFSRKDIIPPRRTIEPDGFAWPDDEIFWKISQALLGSVSSKLRSLQFSQIEKGFLSVFFCLDLKSSSADDEILQKVVDKIVISFPNIEVKVHTSIIPAPNEIPSFGTEVFRRLEHAAMPKPNEFSSLKLNLLWQRKYMQRLG